MDAREPLTRIRIPVAVLYVTTTISLLGAWSMARAGAQVPLSEIPPRAYVAATYDGTVLRLYVNGALMGETFAHGPLDSSSAPVEIGSYAGQAVWSGAIDEVAAYDRPLPVTTITAHYKLGVNQHPPSSHAYRDLVRATNGLVSYWRLDNLGAEALDSHDDNNGVFSPGVAKGAPGLITGESDKSILLNGKFGGVKIPASSSLALRRGFSLEAWVTTVSVANRHIVSRVGSWFLKTDAFGRWTAGVYVKGATITVASRIAAHGPKLPRSARPRREADKGSSFNPLWIVILAVVAAVAVAVRRRTSSS